LPPRGQDRQFFAIAGAHLADVFSSDFAAGISDVISGPNERQRLTRSQDIS
jgi:hypothetical protein